MLNSILLRFALVLSVAAAAVPSYNSRPFAASLQRRQSSNSSGQSLQVDLGYEIYQGVANSTTGLNTWKGSRAPSSLARRTFTEFVSIRFAAPPTGSLRWQAPQTPSSNRSSVIQADAFAPFCPQSPPSPGVGNGYGDEDCLFLNVYSPANATDLPVLVWSEFPVSALLCI